ncbi:MAG: HemK2/MTQ2 family protein methyltransferase [Thermoplasmataceae archaeon]
MFIRIGIHDIEIENCKDVYQPEDDSLLLARSVRCGKRCIEIGSGTGIVSILCAISGSNVTAVDINPLAVECTAKNARSNGVFITVLQSDLFSNVKGIYDTVIFNPPYLPVSDEGTGSEQWSGGDDGFQVTRRFLAMLPQFLHIHGEAFIILSDLTDIKGLMNEFNNLMFIEIGKETFDFESIYCYEIRIK